MDLHLTHIPTDPVVRLFVNGKLAAEIAVGSTETRDQLAAEVARARTLWHLPDIVSNFAAEAARASVLADEGKTPDQKAAGFCRGFAEGYAERLIPHPQPGVPGYRPSEGEAYDRGYEWGESLRRLLAAVGQAERATEAA